MQHVICTFYVETLRLFFKIHAHLVCGPLPMSTTSKIVCKSVRSSSPINMKYWIGMCRVEIKKMPTSHEHLISQSKPIIFLYQPFWKVPQPMYMYNFKILIKIFKALTSSNLEFTYMPSYCCWWGYS